MIRMACLHSYIMCNNIMLYNIHVSYVSVHVPIPPGPTDSRHTVPKMLGDKYVYYIQGDLSDITHNHPFFSSIMQLLKI